MTPAELLDACRVPESVACRTVGLWTINRVSIDSLGIDLALAIDRHIVERLAPYRSITMLMRRTMATLHQPIGECVMEDSPQELRRHLPVLIHGRGHVLISGLGLGCVVRGLLAKPEVDHVDVVEIDRSILTLAGAEFDGNPRVTVHHGNAEYIRFPATVRWDCAWHDVWSEEEALQVVHARLMARYQDRCRIQGAWQFPRVAKRALPPRYIGGPRKRRVA